MKVYGIKFFFEQVRDVKIALSDNCIYLLDGEHRVLMGSSVERTRKGFYYVDVFFKKQFVPWSLLVALD